MKIIERIFRRKELKSLRDKNNLLCQMNNELIKSKIVLGSREKKMLLDALLCDEYKAKVQDPKTNRFIRDIYRALKTKIAVSLAE